MAWRNTNCGGSFALRNHAVTHVRQAAYLWMRVVQQQIGEGRRESRATWARRLHRQQRRPEGLQRLRIGMRRRLHASRTLQGLAGAAIVLHEARDMTLAIDVTLAHSGHDLSVPPTDDTLQQGI